MKRKDFILQYEVSDVLTFSCLGGRDKYEGEIFILYPSFNWNGGYTMNEAPSPFSISFSFLPFPPLLSSSLFTPGFSSLSPLPSFPSLHSNLWWWYVDNLLSRWSWRMLPSGEMGIIQWDYIIVDDKNTCGHTGNCWKDGPYWLPQNVARVSRPFPSLVLRQGRSETAKNRQTSELFY